MKKFILILIFAVLMFIGSLYVRNNDVPKDNTIVQDNLLTQVDNYQIKYWKIIKRHDMFIQIAEIDNDIKKDQSDLKKLYRSVEDRISSENKYLKKLKEIDDKYNSEVGTAQTQTEMNILAGEYHKNTDNILNEVYQKIKIIDKQDKFEALKLSEIKWIKALEDYQNFIKAQDFGSMSGLLYGEAIQDIKHFRTLLLIFYLEQII